MRAMRAEQFSGYEGLKRVDLRKSAISDGKVLLRVTAVGVTPLEHTILSGQFPLAKAPLVLDSEGGGRSGGRRWNEVPCRFTCDVHWDVWRFRGWSLQRVARRVRGQQVGSAGIDQDGRPGARARQHSRQLDSPGAFRTPILADHAPDAAAMAATMAGAG